MCTILEDVFDISATEDKRISKQKKNQRRLLNEGVNKYVTVCESLVNLLEGKVWININKNICKKIFTGADTN